MRRISVLGLSVFREIKRTLGRYIAIFAIIALGVGFFAGLRVSTDSMLKTADEYFREKNLYDFRLISTLGLTQEDVEAFSGLEGVKAAVGSVNADFLCNSGGGDIVLRAHMLTDGMNEADLMAGRMPSAANECTLDALFFGEELIGTVLTLSDENSEDVFDTFACDAYTVVGLVNVPYYVNFERGSTTLGQGKLSGFICLPAEGFDMDLYTEIFLSIEDGGAIYSDEYEAALDKMEPAVSALLEERAALRYDELESEALSKIEDAQAELDDGWETYRSERADAERELDDALERLDDARRELDDGWAQLEDGKTELRKQKDDAEIEFSQARQELDDGWTELEKGKAELREQKTDAEKRFADAQAELDEAARRIDEGAAQLEQCRSLYAAGEALTSGINAAGIGKNYASPNELIMDLASGTNQMLSAIADGALADYGMTARTLCQAWNAAEQQIGAPLSRETISALESALTDARASLYDGTVQLEEARNGAEAAFAEAEEKIAASEAQLNAGETEYAENRVAADDAISKAEREIADSEQKLKDGEAEYADGLGEYEDGRAEADDKFAEAEQKLADGQQKLDEAREKLDELEAPTTYVLDRSMNIGCSTLDNDMGIVRAISSVFPLFFFLVAALVCITTMTRMVDEQRTQNGVLKALGYNGGAIAGQYLFYAGSASALGCIVGFLLGSRFLPMALWRVYRIMYSIDRPAALVLDWGLFAACTALFLICALGATYLVCRRDLRESAAELIRPKSPPAGKRILIERMKFLWKRVKFLHKVSIRNIFLYKKRMFMMILGVGGCTALLLTGFGIRDSIKHIVDYQYDEIELYDCSVSFKNALSAADADAFRVSYADEVSDAVFLHLSAVDLTAGGKTLSINAVGFETEPDGFIDLHQGQAGLPWPGVGETVIDYRLAMDCGLKTGDIITLRDSELRELTLTVTGIFDNYIYDYAFISADTFREQWGSAPEPKSAYLKFAQGADGHAAAAKILGDKNVTAVNLLGDMRERIGNMLSSMDYVVLIVLVCAGALAFIVLYNLINISIGERRREIATLKVLGFYPNESAAYVFRENMVLTGVSAVVGLPMGYALLWFVMSRIKISSFYFGCRAEPMSYVLSVALTFVFAAAVVFLLCFKLEKIDMADSLKAIE